MFSILGLVAKESFADGEQPTTNPDPILIEKKRIAAEREAAYLKAKQNKSNKSFTPRTVTKVDTLDE